MTIHSGGSVPEPSAPAEAPPCKHERVHFFVSCGVVKCVACGKEASNVAELARDGSIEGSAGLRGLSGDTPSTISLATSRTLSDLDSQSPPRGVQGGEATAPGILSAESIRMFRDAVASVVRVGGPAQTIPCDQLLRLCDSHERLRSAFVAPPLSPMDPATYANTEKQLVTLRQSTAFGTSDEKQDAYRIASNNVSAMLTWITAAEHELSTARAALAKATEPTPNSESIGSILGPENRWVNVSTDLLVERLRMLARHTPSANARNALTASADRLYALYYAEGGEADLLAARAALEERTREPELVVYGWGVQINNGSMLGDWFRPELHGTRCEAEATRRAAWCDKHWPSTAPHSAVPIYVRRGGSGVETPRAEPR